MLDIAHTVSANTLDLSNDFFNIFGNPRYISGSRRDLFYLLQQVASFGGFKPAMYQCCGTEDFLYQDNVAFKHAAETSGLPYVYEEESGSHEWNFWDRKIQNVLAWLPINNT